MDLAKLGHSAAQVAHGLGDLLCSIAIRRSVLQ
jgi:hypothetical protein